MFCNIVLSGQEGPDAAHLQQTLPAVHHGKLIHGHQIFAQFLKVLAVGFLRALRDAGVIHINGFFPQQGAPAF